MAYNIADLFEHVVDAVLRLVLVHRDLLEYDVPFGIDVRESRFEQHLPQQGKDIVRVLVEETGVEVGRLLAGCRVERSTEPVEALGYLDRRVVRRSLEEQMLQKVRDPRLSEGLIT